MSAETLGFIDRVARCAMGKEVESGRMAFLKGAGQYRAPPK
ncbi:MAG TPA: hypothetical protein VK137_09440 [Planctomycetaceae bacterium]|nr:hypothetical protein [Planctomycetaceae bacterium]